MPPRSFTSYAKTQYWIGRAVRNRIFQLRRTRIRGLEYVDLGCGWNTHADFINVDFAWHPGVDVCWDIGRGLPFATASMRGIFSEHCLEHFSLPAAAEILRECCRVLAPGGILRLVVPDAGLYLRTYCSRADDRAAEPFPYEEADAYDGVYSPMLSVNRVFYCDRDSSSGHRTMFDFELLQALLRRSGFDAVSRRSFGTGADPHLIIDTPSRAVESLYVEAAVAGAA